MIRINSGEYCDCSYVEITKVPDISILIENNNSTNELETYIEKIKNGFNSLLSEIYQISKNDFSQGELMQNNSFELIWYAEPTKNQTYKANIKFFLVIRCIDDNPYKVKQKLEYYKNIFITSLTSLKYTLNENIDYKIPSFLKIANEFKKFSIVKEDCLGSLQNQLMSQCYIFDKIPNSNQDFAMLIDYLSNCPDAVVSFQLIPTYYSYYEKTYIEQISNTLDTINKGIQDRIIGNVINPIAERYAEKYKYYEKNKNAPLYCFNIILMARQNDLVGLLAKVCGIVNHSTKNEEQIALRVIDISDENIDLIKGFESLPWIINDIIMKLIKYNYHIATNSNFDVRRLSNIITSEECSEFFRLPIGSRNTTKGLYIDYTYKDAKKFHRNIVNANTIEVGKLKSSFGNDIIGFTKQDINKHMLIVGVSGMGKTTYSIGLLHTMWEKYHIPFLVIEPVKSEYRAMIKIIPDIQIFTFGKDDVSPLPINPFIPPKGVKIKQYKSVLKTAFSAGVSMVESLSKLFEETIDEVYSDFGWLDSDTIENPGEIFNIQDFAKCFKRTFERHGYVGEAKNVGTAGLLRLISMSNLFGNYNTVPIDDMLKKPTIIELSAVQNKTEKSFIMALLLLSISTYIDNNYLGDGTLKNIVLIEEAHNLLASNDSNEEGSAKPNAISQELVKNMLAEKRAQGLGIIIADQSPEKVSNDVIKLTNVKIGFNLVEKNDKQIFANSTNMDDKQIERMTQFVEGEAFLFMGGMSKPEEVLIPDYRSTHNIGVTISDSEVKNKSTYWNDKKEKLRPFPECLKNGYCNKTCKLRVKEMAVNISRRIFNKYFTEECKDIQKLKKVLQNLTQESLEILKGKTTLTKELYFCIIVHLLRAIKYGTQINVNTELLNKIFQKSN